MEPGAANLMTHFGPVTAEGLPVIVRGEGCELWDRDGNRYLDALSTLFCVNAGHGRTELAEAAAAQMRELAYGTTWDMVHPPALALAARIAGLAPGDLDRVFFTSGGSESVESALKLVRTHHQLRGEPRRTKVIARELSYHGTTAGALAATGLPSVRTPYEPLAPGGCHVPHTDGYRTDPGRDPLWAADAIEHRIAFEGPETVAAVILEPVQNSGGCLVPPDGYFQRVREICDRHGVLLISDDTICSWGRLGTWFGGQRFGYVPDVITTAKGITSAYAPMGAVIVSERVAAPFLEQAASFQHGLTFGGHPVAAAVALANIDLIEREDLLGRVRANEPLLRDALEQLRDIPLVGDVRGAGYFWGIELVADRETKARFAPEQAKEVVAALDRGIKARGLICRAVDRGFPVIQLAPPLVAGPAEFEEIAGVLRAAMTEAAVAHAR
jgi:adenosylmethionine-8-amino-7-oxononanoate aminotransferase